jgi:1,4-dihydroxy-2-naphthoate octaprenyltransferase
MIEVIFAHVGLLLLIALLTESLTEVIKNIVPNHIIKDKLTYTVSIVVGIVLSYAFGLNLFGLTGFGEHVSKVAAGLIASRGANYVNGFMKKIGVLKTGNKTP